MLSALPTFNITSVKANALQRDVSFNESGVVNFYNTSKRKINLGGKAFLYGDAALDMTRLSNGKILLLGYSHSDRPTGLNGDSFTEEYHPNVALWKYNSNGTLDTTFNNKGYMLINNGRGEFLKVLPNGDMLIGGSTLFSDAGVAKVWSVTKDGVLKTSYGNNGSLEIQGYSDIADLMLFEDGSALVTATAYEGSAAISKMVKLSSNGSVLSTYEIKGRKIEDTVIQGDGQVVALEVDYSNGDVFLAKYDSNGNHISATPLSFFNPYDAGILKQLSSEKIIAISNTSSNLKVQRYNKDLTIDPSFNLLDLNPGASGGINVRDVEESEDNKLIIAASDRIWRVNPNGSLDPSFGNNGKVSGIGDDTFFGFSITEFDGNFLYAGRSNYTDSETQMTLYNLTENSLQIAFKVPGEEAQVSSFYSTKIEPSDTFTAEIEIKNVSIHPKRIINVSFTDGNLFLSPDESRTILSNNCNGVMLDANETCSLKVSINKSEPGFFDKGEFDIIVGESDSVIEETVRGSILLQFESSRVPVYRFLNKIYGSAHFYTSNENQYNVLMEKGGIWEKAFSYEKIAFYVYNPTENVCKTGEPVYRFRNDALGGSVHFYTIKTSEVNTLITNIAPGGKWEGIFANEGIAYCAFSNLVDNTVPIYRFRNEALGGSAHFYTSNTNEYSKVVNNSKPGGIWEGVFVAEGIAYYAYPN